MRSLHTLWQHAWCRYALIAAVAFGLVYGAGELATWRQQ